MLKILVVNDVFPHISNRTSIFFRNIVSLLSKKFEIKVYWVITDDYGKRYEEKNPHYEILFLSDFKNAREVIEKIKPSIIYHLIGYSFIDYAFILAGRLLKIPSFGYADSGVADYFAVNTSLLKVYSEYVRQFFERQSIEENEEVKKMRGVNFTKKYLFLIKTLRSIGYSYKKIILELLGLMTLQIHPPIQFNAKFNCDLMFVENLRSIEYNVKGGLKREKMLVVGNPVFDNAFKKREQSINIINNKLNVLLLTANFASGQGESDWTIKKRNCMIKELMEKLNNTDKIISITIKIHPTSESYQQYKKLLKKYAGVRLIQNEDVIDLITKSDVILTHCTSTAGIIALIMKKPIVLWNYFNVKQDLLLRKGVVLECNKSQELLNSLQMAKAFRDKNEEKIENLVKEEFVDGESTQKIINELEKWINKIGIHV